MFTFDRVQPAVCNKVHSSIIYQLFQLHRLQCVVDECCSKCCSEAAPRRCEVQKLLSEEGEYEWLAVEQLCHQLAYSLASH